MADEKQVEGVQGQSFTPPIVKHEISFQRFSNRIVQGWCTCGFLVQDKVKRVVIQQLRRHRDNVG